MDKITVKDVKQYLSMKGKISVTGKHAFSLAKQSFQKFKNGCKKLLNTIKEKTVQAKDKAIDLTTNTVSDIKTKILPNEEIIEQARQEQANKKIENIDNKRNELKQFVGQMEQQDEYRIGTKNCYLKEVKQELRKLDKQRMNVSKKGLGVFALTKLTLSNMKNNIKNKWANYLQQKEENKNLDSIEKMKEIIKSNYERLKELKEEEKNIREKYPEINNEEVPNIVTNINDGKETEIAETYTKVKEIKNPDKDKKEEIKKSSNFKNALAAIALVTGIALTAGTVANINNKNNNDDLAINTPTKVEYNIEQQKEIEQKENIQLGDYLTIENGSTIYQTPELNGSHGIIGTNGYDDSTLFKINAVTYVDENNNEVSFNTVQKDEQSKKLIEEEHKKYIENHPDLKIKKFHITPCDNLGIPIAQNQSEIDLGGWTDTNNSNIKNVEMKDVVINAYEFLGGRAL